MTAVTSDLARTTTTPAVPTSLRATSQKPVRGSVVTRWLVAMLEQAQVRATNRPELSEYLSA